MGAPGHQAAQPGQVPSERSSCAAIMHRRLCGLSACSSISQHGRLVWSIDVDRHTTPSQVSLRLQAWQLGRTLIRCNACQVYYAVSVV